MQRLWTVGHSNLPLEQFLERVRPVEVVADIRRFPSSRKFPHFNREHLQKVVDYRWFPALGGRRHGGGERHTALRTPGFRSYADYMATPEFRAALAELEALARERRVAIMCSEALWFRCHRWLVSDMLVNRGWEVLHLPGEKPHPLSRFARLEGDTLIYDVEAEERV